MLTAEDINYISLIIYRYINISIEAYSNIFQNYIKYYIGYYVVYYEATCLLHAASRVC